MASSEGKVDGRLKRTSKLADILQKLHKNADGDCIPAKIAKLDSSISVNGDSKCSENCKVNSDKSAKSTLKADSSDTVEKLLMEHHDTNGNATGDTSCTVNHDVTPKTDQRESHQTGDAVESREDTSLKASEVNHADNEIISTVEKSPQNETEVTNANGANNVNLPKSNCQSKNEAPSTSKESTSRSSRRKQQKTRKVVESDDEELVTGDPLSGDVVDTLLMYDNVMTEHDDDNADVTQHNDNDADVLLPICDSALLNYSLVSPENCDDSATTVAEHEREDFILPEGTVFLLPEDVEASPKPQEVNTCRGKSFKGLEATIINCTACNRQLGTNHTTDLRRHPTLKVLVCRKCYNHYNSIDIEKDSDGSDEMCRWCVQGGDLICCDYCHNAMCKNCIRRNLGRKELGKILDAEEGSKWKCYICDPKPLLRLIENCTSVMEAMVQQEHKDLERRNKKSEHGKNRPENSSKNSQVVSVIQSSKSSKPVSNAKSGAVVQQQQRLLLGDSRGYNRAAIAQRTASVQPGQSNDVIVVDSSPFKMKSGELAVPATPPGPDVLTIVDHMLSSTQSMSMFLSTLSTDLESGTSSNGTSSKRLSFSQEQLLKRYDVAEKFKRGYTTYMEQFKNNVRLIKSCNRLIPYTRRSGAPARPLPQAAGAPQKTLVVSPVSAISSSVVVIPAELMRAVDGGQRPSVVQTAPSVRQQTIMKSGRLSDPVISKIRPLFVLPPSSISTPVVLSPEQCLVSSKPSGKPSNEVIELSDSDEELMKDFESVAAPPQVLPGGLYSSQRSENSRATDKRLSTTRIDVS